MRRIIIYILLALAIVGAMGAPAIAAAACECTMATMADMDVDGDMGCCTPECATACPAMAITFDGTGMSTFRPAPLVAASAYTSLWGSIAPESLDPPPRIHLT